MTFNPAARPPEYTQLLNDAVVGYEDGATPTIAIARRGVNAEIAAIWVTSHNELMMFPDDDHFALAFIDADGIAKFESVPFWHYSDEHEAATKMRNWLRGRGLV